MSKTISLSQARIYHSDTEILVLSRKEERPKEMELWDRKPESMSDAEYFLDIDRQMTAAGRITGRTVHYQLSKIDEYLELMDKIEGLFNEHNDREAA